MKSIPATAQIKWSSSLMVFSLVLLGVKSFEIVFFSAIYSKRHTQDDQIQNVPAT